MQTFTKARGVENPEAMPSEMAVGKFECVALASRDGDPLATLGDLGEIADSVTIEVIYDIIAHSGSSKLAHRFANTVNAPQGVEGPAGMTHDDSVQIIQALDAAGIAVGITC